MSINECYPDHANALARAGLSMKNFPTLTELWDNADQQDKKKKEKRKRKRGGKRNTYLCIEFSQLWLEKIHCVIKKLQIPII